MRSKFVMPQGSDALRLGLSHNCSQTSQCHDPPCPPQAVMLLLAEMTNHDPLEASSGLHQAGNPLYWPLQPQNAQQVASPNWILLLGPSAGHFEAHGGHQPSSSEVISPARPDVGFRRLPVRSTIGLASWRPEWL